MPGVADAALTAPEPPSVRPAKGLTPVPDRFIRDGDAAVREEVFDLPETEAESKVEPDGVTDNDGRKPIAWVAQRVGHSGTVPALASS